MDKGVLWLLACDAANAPCDNCATSQSWNVRAYSAGALRGYEPMDALRDKDYGKPRMRYSDFVETPSGLQYKVVCNRHLDWLLTVR
jgi:hypothetical protein